MCLDDVYTEILDMVSSVGARIEVPYECQVFLSDKVEKFSGSREELLKYISDHVAVWFRCISSRPRWIQEAEWLFHNGKPMMFVGQLDIGRATDLFHDDASIFIFISPEGGTIKSVVQVA